MWLWQLNKHMMCAPKVFCELVCSLHLVDSENCCISNKVYAYSIKAMQSQTKWKLWTRYILSCQWYSIILLVKSWFLYLICWMLKWAGLKKWATIKEPRSYGQMIWPEHVWNCKACKDQPISSSYWQWLDYQKKKKKPCHRAHQCTTGMKAIQSSPN